jgi:hypothetical protein
MRNSRTATAGLSLLVTTVGGTLGCNALGDIGDIIFPRRITVRLVNPGDFPVEVNLFYGDEQDTIEDLLEEFGEQVVVTVAPGDTYTFSRSCDDFQAVFIEDADLQLVGDIGPGSGTEVFSDGDDFGCGDTITFTFNYAAIPFALDIDFTAN